MGVLGLCLKLESKWKNHFSEMKGDVRMSLHEKEEEHDDAYTIIETIGPHTTAHISAREPGSEISTAHIVALFLCYRLYRFRGVQRGHKKCPVFNRTHVARVAIGPFALSGNRGRDATRLQLKNRYRKAGIYRGVIFS